MTLFGQEHVDRYVATDGQEGHDWQGTQTLILTTKGRRSGQERHHALIYGRHGDDYLVVASMGGAPQHPARYLNLDANPEVEIQVKADKNRAHARTATLEEKPELWSIMTKEWPDYDRYKAFPVSYRRRGGLLFKRRRFSMPRSRLRRAMSHAPHGSQRGRFRAPLLDRATRRRRPCSPSSQRALRPRGRRRSGSADPLPP
jgi:deazaflavin-dependent oxidoreductase (nitroreductase family)